MSALPPSQMRAMRMAAAPAIEPPVSLETRWDALHARASQLAALAQLGAETHRGDVPEIGALLDNANDWQREIAQRGVEDLDAMMDIGLRAISTLTERGQDASTPALTLWREFYHAREAVLAALQPHQQAA